MPNDADNFKEGVRLAHTFSFETLTFCSALSLVSVTSKRLYGDYISSEHINHRVLAPLAVVFCEILLLMVFKRLDRVICRIAWPSKTRTTVTMDTSDVNDVTAESGRPHEADAWSESSAKKAVRRSKPLLSSRPLAFAFTRLEKRQKKMAFFVVVERLFTSNERNHGCEKKEK